MLTLETLDGQLVGGKWHIDRLLARGGMSAVYSGWHEITEKPAAIKILDPNLFSDPAARARFKREVTASAKIRHPGIVDVFDAGTDPDLGVHFVVMELLEGEDLRGRITLGRLALDEVHRIVDDALEALEAAHARGLVHRDLKPENIFLAEAHDGVERVKLVDFGIARDIGARSATASATAMGTPQYMSPEQMQSARSAGAPADVWSMGVILHELLSGELPFLGDTIPALIVAVCTRDPKPLPGTVHRDLRAIVKRCLDRDPARRPSVTELRALLNDALGSTATILDPVPAPHPVPPPVAPPPQAAPAKKRPKRVAKTVPMAAADVPSPRPTPAESASSVVRAARAAGLDWEAVRPAAAVAVAGLAALAGLMMCTAPRTPVVAPAPAAPSAPAAATTASPPRELSDVLRAPLTSDVASRFFWASPASNHRVEVQVHCDTYAMRAAWRAIGRMQVPGVDCTADECTVPGDAEQAAASLFALRDRGELRITGFRDTSALDAPRDQLETWAASMDCGAVETFRSETAPRPVRTPRAAPEAAPVRRSTAAVPAGELDDEAMLGEVDGSAEAVDVVRTADDDAPLGELTSEQISRVVTRERTGLRRCWETAVRGMSETPAVRFDVDITIGSSGIVIWSDARGPEVGTLGNCIELSVRRWRFPASSGTSRTSFPVVFSGTDESSPAGPDGLPETPSETDVRRVLAAAMPRLRACAEGEVGTAHAAIVIRNDGSVGSVSVSGSPFGGTPAGACMEGVIRGASFPRFRQTTFRVSYPILIRPTP